ncbi:hypothetical protein GAMM_60052 [Gammaproteobacteria bacterium]
MGIEKHKFPFPPSTALKKFMSKLLGHLGSTRQSRWVLEGIVKDLKKKGRNAEATEVSKIIKKITKHERALVEKKKQLLAEHYELKLKELDELLKQIELSEKKTKEFIKEFAKFFKEFNDPVLKEKLDHLAELYDKRNQILAEITECKKEIEQCQDKIKQNEVLIDANIQAGNEKVCIIDKKKEDLVSDFVPEIEAQFKLFLEESGITISLSDNLISKLLIEYVDSHHDFKMGDKEWNDDFVRFCVTSIMPLLIMDPEI